MNTYDPIGELKTALGSEASGASRLQEQLRYVYDPAGNLNYRTNNALVQTFKVNNLNELTNLTRSGTIRKKRFPVVIVRMSLKSLTNLYVSSREPRLGCQILFIDSNACCQSTICDGRFSFSVTRPKGPVAGSPGSRSPKPAFDLWP